MQLKKKHLFNNSIRHQISIKKNLLLKKNKIIKYLVKDLKKNKGRSSYSGHITVRHKGKGCKKKIHITTKSLLFFGINIGQMYNSYGNNFISLNFDLKKKKFFKTNSIEKATTGTMIASDIKKKKLLIGFQNSLKNLPSGSIINTVFSTDLNKINYAKSSGNFCQILDNRTNYVLRLPSGKIININHKYTLFGKLGKVSNFQSNLLYIGKAGRNRNKGIRPSVRGIAMNPVDHPHGGRTNGGRPSVTPWGKPTKGKPTVIKKN